MKFKISPKFEIFSKSIYIYQTSSIFSHVSLVVPSILQLGKFFHSFFSFHVPSI